MKIVSSYLETLLEIINEIIFFSIGGENGIPLIVLWLVAGGLFLTIRMKLINLFGFKHAIVVVAGKYDREEEVGEVSHFAALSVALSATVGLGNIAGVAIAISIGGPGAVFWMTLAGFLGMASKFTECTLGHKYRQIKPDGTVAGGPMYYLEAGLASLGQPLMGKILATSFALLAIASALGSSSIYQANQSLVAVTTVIPSLTNFSWIYGLGVAILVGLVIIGGIRRIGLVAEFLIPIMCGIYICTCVWVIVANFSLIPQAIETIITQAFFPKAVTGGITGAMIQGFRRSAFSCEAGVGIAAIAHGAAKTSESVREGIVALLEPFIDTIIICNLTALTLIVTGVHNDPQYQNLSGAALTSAALSTVVSWFPSVLAIAVFFFAFSTMTTWGYYGQLCWSYLFGEKSVILYQILFLLAIFLGSIINPQTVIEFSDALFITMAFPNLIGLYCLSPQVARELTNYWEKYLHS